MCNLMYVSSNRKAMADGGDSREESQIPEDLSGQRKNETKPVFQLREYSTPLNNPSTFYISSEPWRNDQSTSHM